MGKTQFEQILDQIASVNGISATQVRENLRTAMTSALDSPNPAVQAMWESIPRKGRHPTLEEFMDYLIENHMVQP